MEKKENKRMLMDRTAGEATPTPAGARETGPSDPSHKIAQAKEHESRTGRPTKFNKATIDRLCEALSDGLSIKSACVVAGVGVSTLADWREQHPGLEEQMSEAREVARQKALKAIQAAGEKDWRAHAEWLKLAFPADYRGNANKIEVSATALASSGPVVTEAERQRLIERHERAMLANGDGETA
jgi:hypothetical protein